MLGASVPWSVLLGGTALLVSLAVHGVVQRRTHVAARDAATG